MLRPVGYIRSDYKEKFGIPKQCGLVNELEQAVVFKPEFCNMDCLRDIYGSYGGSAEADEMPGPARQSGLRQSDRPGLAETGVSVCGHQGLHTDLILWAFRASDFSG